MKAVADLMASSAVGTQHAINLDGGGSSTFVVNGTVKDFPTCNDVNVKCERPVATAMCIA